MFPRIPVTILAGLPGSGKAQLLQHLVGEAPDGRMAVIQDDRLNLASVLLLPVCLCT
jgi:Ni2+-binding GTPase involved in maturation of urease and hydrogenase